jgi:hypothetical protein
MPGRSLIGDSTQLLQPGGADTQPGNNTGQRGLGVAWLKVRLPERHALTPDLSW